MSEEQSINFINQATQSLQSGQLNQALDFANQALLLNPESADAYVIKAVALAQMNQAAEATQAFEDALRIDPSNAKTRFNLAVHLVRQNQKTEALTQVREALASDPSHVGARDLLTQLERELGVAPAGQASVPPIQQPGQTTEVPGAQSPYGQNPYQQSPYGSPQQPYYAPTSQHNLPFVENMGKNWEIIGWAFVIVWLLLFLVQMPQAIAQVQEAMRNPGAPPPQQQGNPIITVLGLANALGGITWMIMDILDRRGNWLWFVLYLLCCCCAPIQALYMALGRKK